jgi:ADP-heptose:LPS heptosyltransferase
MHTTFIISGGAGRTVAAIPALEKYHRLNPNDDFKVLVHGWQELFWSHPILQDRTFPAHQKGVFENYIKNNRVVTPEPYTLNNFFNEKKNLVEAFDEIINDTDNHSDLTKEKYLYTSIVERHRSCELFNNYIDKTKKDKIIVFQPFGSSVEIINGSAIDRSSRSLSKDNYYKIVQELSKFATIIYASMPQFRHADDNISITFDEHRPYLRVLISFIEQCDYYVGVCSVGQHIARALNKSGSVLMGGTNEKSFSYPEHFSILRKEGRSPIYTPWRLSEGDCEFADRANEGIMSFNDQEIKEICGFIKEKLFQSFPVDENSTNVNSNGLIYD